MSLNIDHFLKEESATTLLLSIYVQPGASKSQWSGIHGDELKLRIKAPPVEGQANKEVAAFLAKYFGLSKSKVELTKGEISRHKTFRLYGITKAEVLSQIQTLLT